MHDNGVLGSSQSIHANSPQSPSLFVLLLLPFALLLGAVLERWTAAIVSVLVLLLAISNAKLSSAEKDQIRFDVYSIPDILSVVLRAKAACNENDAVSTNEFKTILLTALSAMAKKYNVETAKQGSGKNAKETNPTVEHALCCQEVACIGIQTFGDDDDDDDENKILMASIALLALIAGVPAVRKRHAQVTKKKKENVLYSLQTPFRALQKALTRAKAVQDSKKEQDAAELQRKGCLWIGALADNDAAMAELVVKQGGLPLVIDAISWYRFHKEVVNWGLWAIFILCYESPGNKLALQTSANGISAIINGLRCSGTESEEVARHGVAILFDMLRQDPFSDSVDVIRIRDAALVAGLHDTLVSILEQHCRAMDIMMMGRELLIGTGYRGNVPEYTP